MRKPIHGDDSGPPIDELDNPENPSAQQLPNNQSEPAPVKSPVLGSTGIYVGFVLKNGGWWESRRTGPQRYIAQRSSDHQMYFVALSLSGQKQNRFLFLFKRFQPGTRILVKILSAGFRSSSSPGSCFENARKSVFYGRESVRSDAHGAVRHRILNVVSTCISYYRLFSAFLQHVHEKLTPTYSSFRRHTTFESTTTKAVLITLYQAGSTPATNSKPPVKSTIHSFF